MKFYNTGIAALILFYPSCSDTETFCPADSTDLGFGSCIVYDDSGLLNDHETDMTMVAVQTIEEINALMPIEGLRIIVNADATSAIPEVGVGGFNPNTDEVIISFDPANPGIINTIASEFPIQLTHEIHHARRRRAIGYGNTLLQALISEGLADHFSEEVTGSDPSPWSVAFPEEQLDDWIDIMSPLWNEQGYDHARWFYGTMQDVPRWTGYTVGYLLVKRYLSDNPGSKASELFGESAGSFAP